MLAQSIRTFLKAGPVHARRKKESGIPAQTFWQNAIE
jgi:hypothetical protein